MGLSARHLWERKDSGSGGVADPFPHTGKWQGKGFKSFWAPALGLPLNSTALGELRSRGGEVAGHGSCGWCPVEAELATRS